MGHESKAVKDAIALIGSVDPKTGKPITAYAAAKKKRLALSTIYRALARRAKAP